MSRYIGSTGGTVPTYFYRFERDETGYLTFTKVDINADGDEIVINDVTARGDQESQLDFDLSNDVVVINMDENHALINKSAGVTQYKIKAEDLLYFLDDNGEMIVRINGSYDYPVIV